MKYYWRGYMKKMGGWLKSASVKYRAEMSWFMGAFILSTTVTGIATTGTIYGAKWWELFTAFGTVGSVVVALASMLSISYKSRKKRRMDSALALSGEIERINYYRVQLYGLTQKVSAGYEPEAMKREFLECFGGINKYLESLVSYEYSGYDPNFINLVISTKGKSINLLLHDLSDLVPNSIDIFPNLIELAPEMKVVHSDLLEIIGVCRRAKKDLIKWWS